LRIGFKEDDSGSRDREADSCRQAADAGADDNDAFAADRSDEKPRCRDSSRQAAGPSISARLGLQACMRRRLNWSTNVVAALALNAVGMIGCD
jgi:hypothetical protein